MDIKSYKTGIVIKNYKHFNLETTFESGQCFRWNKNDDGSYIGIVTGKVLNIKRLDNDIFMYPTNKAEFNSLWMNYFDLNKDYCKIDKELIGKDEYLDEALKFSNGLRLLRQDPWETTVSFIISANNNIPRIKNIIENISKAFGTHIYDDYYAFPLPDQLSNVGIEMLRECGLGYRDKYVLQTAKDFYEKKIDLNKLKGKPINEVKKELVLLKGVGEKVAECIMLFSLDKEEVIPIDTWVKKIIDVFYSDEIKEYKDANEFFYRKYGKYSGYVQQVLFYWARQTELKR